MTEPIEVFIEENTVPNFDQLCDDPQALIDHLVSTGQAEPGRLVVDEFEVIDTAISAELRQIGRAHV